MLQAPDFKIHINKKNAVNKDIRETLYKDLPIAIEQARPLVKIFKGKNELETANKIWLYLRNNIKYKKDDDGFQDIRLPRRFHHDKTGDCKSYSINAMAIYKAIYPHLPVSPKFTSYDIGATEPTHVYAAVKDSAGRIILIDGCYNHFNSEKEFTLALPLKWDMQVRTLSNNTSTDTPAFHAWYDNLPPAARREVKQAMQRKLQMEQIKAGLVPLENCMSICNKIESEIGATKAEKKARRAKRRKKAGLFFKKLGHGVAFITLAPVRGALAALIALNLNGLASNLRLVEQAKDQSHFNKLLKFWDSVGGIKKAFLKAIALGTKHKALWMGKKAHQKFLARAKEQGLKPTDAKWLRGINGGESIGLLPAAIPPLIAMGSGLLAAVLPILKKALDGTGHHAQAASVEGTAEDLIDAHNAGQLGPDRYENSDMLDAHEPGDPDNEDEDPDEQGEASDDFTSIDEDLFTEAAAAANKIAPPGAALDTFNALGPALDTLFQTGVSVASDVIKKKTGTDPHLKQLLHRGETYADDYFTRKHLKKHGIKYPGKGISHTMMLFGGGALLALVVLSKNNNPVNGLYGIGRGIKKFVRFKR